VALVQDPAINGEWMAFDDSQEINDVFQSMEGSSASFLSKLSEIWQISLRLNSDFTFKDVDVLCKDLDRGNGGNVATWRPVPNRVLRPGGDGKVSHKEFLHWLKKGNDLTQALYRNVLWLEDVGRCRKKPRAMDIVQQQ
jgi:hypothetical protein